MAFHFGAQFSLWLADLAVGGASGSNGVRSVNADVTKYHAKDCSDWVSKKTPVKTKKPHGITWGFLLFSYQFVTLKLDEHFNVMLSLF